MMGTKLLFAVLVFSVILYGCSSGYQGKFGPLGSVHNHADIKVYILNNPIDFYLPQYQLQDQLTHFENGDGDVVHTHATGINLGYLFETLGMELNSECFRLDTGNNYCARGNAQLNVFVKNINGDWNQVTNSETYIIQQSDKILINYGTQDEEGLNVLMDTVTDKSPTY
jgi:hypothetical protein